MERRGGVEGNKSPFKIYAGAQIRKENFNGNKEDHHKEDSGKEDREEAEPEDHSDVEQRQWPNARMGDQTRKQKEVLAFVLHVNRQEERR